MRVFRVEGFWNKRADKTCLGGHDTLAAPAGFDLLDGGVSEQWMGAGAILLGMQLILAHIGARIPGGDEFNRLTEHYLQRTSALMPAEAMPFRSEDDLLAWLNRKQGRTPPVAVLLDSRGRAMTSEAFAAWMGERRDQGIQQVVLAIGPASGWSEEARKRAQLLLSLGPLTMAHALARLVLAEQLYRACTILAGHPYHVGH